MRFVLLFLTFVMSLHASEKTTISSDTAHYDGDKIKLDGHVILESAMGKVFSNKALLIRDMEGKSSIDFPWAELFDGVRIELSNNGMIECTKVYCDYLTLKTTLMGDPHVHYVDEEGELLASRAEIEYTQIDGKLTLMKIILIGDVRMESANEKKESAIYYALADRVEYSPQDDLIVLKSDENKRVLFFDKLNEMQLSAETVLARRRGESVQGLGDVRFVFKDDELLQLKENFKW